MKLPKYWTIGDQIRLRQEERERLRSALEQREGEPGATAPASPALRNPFSREHWNLTEQMRMMKKDPERAKRLKGES